MERDKTMKYEELEFLRESNNIENVWDDLSFQQALIAWDFLKSEEALTVAVVLKTHKLLMLHQKIQPTEKGYLRQEQVWVAGREGKPWFALPELVENWVRRINNRIENDATVEDVEALEQLIKEDHVDYETIHPFIDGNGRTGRIFMNWERLKCGLPILVIKNDEKKDYYKWFETSDEARDRLISYIDISSE